MEIKDIIDLSSMRLEFNRMQAKVEVVGFCLTFWFNWMGLHWNFQGPGLCQGYFGHCVGVS